MKKKDYIIYVTIDVKRCKFKCVLEDITQTVLLADTIDISWWGHDSEVKKPWSDWVPIYFTKTSDIADTNARWLTYNIKSYRKTIRPDKLTISEFKHHIESFGLKVTNII